MIDEATPLEAGRAPVGHGTAQANPATTVALAVALFALSALDLVVTEIGVVHYGATEMNPLMAPMLGTPWALVVKIGLPGFILLLAHKVRTTFAIRALRTAVAVYLVVVCFNLIQFALVVTK